MILTIFKILIIYWSLLKITINIMSSILEKAKLFSGGAKKIQKEEDKNIKTENKQIGGNIKNFLDKINQKFKDNNQPDEPKKPIKIANRGQNKIQEKLKELEQNKNKIGNKEKVEEKINFIPISERKKNLQESQNTQIKKDSNNNFIPTTTGSIKDKINKINQLNEKKTNLVDTPEEKPKILENSEIISNENPNLIIYKYPNIKFSKNISNNCKILIFLGNNQDKFTNAFINYYRDISFKDGFRYKIETPIFTNNTNNSFLIYDIKERTSNKNFKIISFPYFNQNNEIFESYKLMIELLELLKNKIPKRIHSIFVTIDEKKNFEKYEIIFFYLFIYLFKKGGLKDKINILFTPDNLEQKTSDNNNYIELVNNFFNSNFLVEDNFDKYFSSLYVPEFFVINNKAIFDNNENTEKEWNLLKEEINKIHKKISNSEILDDNKISFMNNIFHFNGQNKNNILKEFRRLEREEQIILINYLIKCNFPNDISFVILDFYNKIENTNYKINEDSLYLSNIKNNKIYIISKIKFNNLQELSIKSDLNDEYLNIISSLFTAKLRKLNLTNNKITDMNIFNKENIFSNLEYLDLSFNNISNINFLSDCKFPNLLDLNLSHNEIIDIDCLNNDNLNLLKLYSLHLSFNKIKTLKKINIKTLCILDLLNNSISSGINDFIDNLDNYKDIKDKLIIEYNNNELIFNYSKVNNKNFFIKFNYIVEKENINNVLEQLKFKTIKNLIIKGFNNIDFLSNESLNSLCELDLESNDINDITIFNKIHFLKIKKINVNSIKIYQGYQSLKVFLSIRTNSVEIYPQDNKYIWKIYFHNPYIFIKFISDDLNFLKEEIFSEVEDLSISQDIIDKNTEIFSFESIKRSIPMFSKIKVDILKIDCIDNKYKAFANFLFPNFSKTFIFDNLNFLRDDFLSGLREISIPGNIIQNNSSFFSLDSITTSFPIFRNLISEKIDITFKENKYHFNCSFYNPRVNLEFIFDNLSYLTNPLFSEAKSISFTQSYLNEYVILSKEKFPKLHYLSFKNNTIEDINVFKEINSFSISSEGNLCKNDLIDLFDEKSFIMEKIILKENINMVQIDYYKPFNFYVLITKEKLNDLKFFKWAKKINLPNINLTNDDINFLKEETLLYLKDINLDGNKITNINFLDKIQSRELQYVSVKNNPINDGILDINEKLPNLKIRTIQTQIENDKHKLSLYYKDDKNTYELYFDYLIDIQQNLDILHKINLEEIKTLNLSNIKLKNIDFLLNNSFKKLNYLYLDSNEIEDINILSNGNIGILYVDNMSIRDNPIKIGLNALLHGLFFNRSIYIELGITRIGQEFKISAIFKYPNINIDFFVNNINELNNYFDFENRFIKFENKDNIEEAKIIEDQINKSKNKKQFEIILYILDNRNNYNDLTICYEDNNDYNDRTLWNKKIIINDNNAESFENVFKIISSKNWYWALFSGISKLRIENLTSKHENIIQYLPFHYLKSLELKNCNFDLNILKKTEFYGLTELDLSDSSFTDIKGICGDVPFSNKLEILNLSNNKSISNLYELKNAKFTELKKLYLSNNDIYNLNDIKMAEYNFKNLNVLDLSNNHIQYLSPISRFNKLILINLENNEINQEDELDYIIYIRRIILKGNCVCGPQKGIF